MRSRRCKPSPDPQLEREHRVLEETRESGFCWATCEAWRRLTIRFGMTISHMELLSLAKVVAHYTNIELVREAKRRKELLIKWFDDNLERVWPFIEEKIRIEDLDDRNANQ